MKTKSVLLLFLSMLLPFKAQALDEILVKQRYKSLLSLQQFDQFKSVQNLDPYRRRTLDLEAIEAELEIIFNPDSLFEFEVEYEHGGTGTALEYEALEEFGEFESEVERGGEVAIEEAYYRQRLANTTYVIIGKAPLYLSLDSALYSPLDSAAPLLSRLEARMIPLGWKETGVQIESRHSDFTLRAGLVTGLNSEFFRKYNWVGGGHQRQFESMNADDLASVASVEYGDAIRGRGVAIGFYQGNSTNNRHKKDKLTEDAIVTIASAMGSWSLGDFTFTAQVIRGWLKNSEAVTTANNTLGNFAKPGVFGAVGARADLESAQLRYDITPEWAVFIQREHVNTFAEVEGSVYADPRYEVLQNGLGFFHRWNEICFLKFHAWRETTHLEGLPDTDTLLLQFGFDTGEF